MSCIKIERKMGMIKIFSAVILLFFLISADLTFAQGISGGIKIYSGCLHKNNVKSNGGFWHSLFGVKSSKQEEFFPDRQCAVEFKSPVSFSHQSVAMVPESLSYFVRFINTSRSSRANAVKEKGAFGKYIIKIYTNGEQEYSLDPDSGDKIFDSYLIYLILGSDINRLEVVSISGVNEHGKYVLDKSEVHNNQ